MKKLTYLISAVAAAVAGSAHADVSVSGSGGAAYLSKATTGDKGNVVVSSALNFGLSTTAANGMGIAAGMSLTVTPASDQTAPSAGGGNKLTFTTGGATIVVGDIELADTYGSVGGVVGGVIGDAGGTNSDVKTGFADDDGTGVSLSTSVGAATVTMGHIFNTGGNTNSSTDSNAAMTAFSASMPMGPATLGIGVADGDAAESSTGATISAALGGGTLTVGYSTQTLVADATATTVEYSLVTATGAISTTDITAAADDLDVNGDSEVIGATYSMALDADTTVSLGYQSAKDADSDSHTRVDASISRSLGGGASVYLDIRSLNGDTDTSGTDIAVGTSVSF